MLTNTFTTVALVALSTVGMAAATPPSPTDDTDRRSAASSPEPSGHRAATAQTSPPRTSSAHVMATAPIQAGDVSSLVPSLTSSIDDLVVELRQADGEAADPLDPAVELRAIAEAVEAVELDEDVYVGDDGERIDAQRLRLWLENRDSPMAEHAEVLVAAGIEHDVDPRLVVAIATKESLAGIHLPPGSHNAWGWGGSGAHGLAAWPSWPHAIDYYTERLGALYDTDSVDAEMAERYCPPNWRSWLETVRWVIQDI